MIGHFFTSAWHHYLRAPFTTLINFTALALGIASFLAAWGVAAFWGLTDSEFDKSDRIMVITQQFVSDGVEPRPSPDTAAPLGRYLQIDAPIIQEVGQITFAADETVKTGGRSLNMRGSQASPGLLKIFDFDFISGDAQGALDATDGMVITQEAAKLLFGEEDPMGKQVQVGNQRDVTITGVIEAPAEPSALGQGPGTRGGFDFLLHWEEGEEGSYEHWIGVSARTYALLPEGNIAASRATLNEQLLPLGKRRVPENQMDLVGNIWFGTLSLDELQTKMLDRQLFPQVSKVVSVTRVLFGLGFIILLVSCINYANLATAQAAGYAKEVGLRKVVGAGRASISLQYWLEALILAVFALLVALLTIALVSPVLDAATGIDIQRGLKSQSLFWPVCALLTFVISVAASFYPCVYLGNIRPVEALRSGKVKGGSRLLTELLVGVQFAAASALLIIVLVVGQQNRFMQESVLQPDADPVLMLTDADSTSIPQDDLASALAGQPGIRAVSAINFEPWSGYVNYLNYAKSRDDLATVLTGQISYVGLGFFDTFEAELIAGRVYSRERDMRDDEADDTQTDDDNENASDAPLVIDRYLAADLGYDNPEDAIGQYMYLSRQMALTFNADPSFRIIGVVETVPLVVGAGGARANMYVLDGSTGYYPLIRIDRTMVREGLASIERVVKSRQPDAALMTRFLDSEFEQSFRTYDGVNKGFQGLSLIAFTISAMGLFAMAMFTATRRRHEIGVRKTLGASTGQIMLLLLKDFSRPVLLANLLAWPIAFFGARAYLGGFMQRIELTPMPWIIALAITLTIAWVAVGGQAWRAARVNPAEVLKSE